MMECQPVSEKADTICCFIASLRLSERSDEQAQSLLVCSACHNLPVDAMDNIDQALGARIPATSSALCDPGPSGPAEVMCATARLHSHDAGRHRFGESGYILRPDTPALNHGASLIQPHEATAILAQSIPRTAIGIS
jgi:hypothetical protein